MKVKHLIIFFIVSILHISCIFIKRGSTNTMHKSYPKPTEVYITPRSVARLYFYYNGIGQYQLMKKSIKVAYVDRDYVTLKQDSVFQLFYTVTNGIHIDTNKLAPLYQKNLLPNAILLVFHQNKMQDSVYLDIRYNIYIHNKWYKPNKAINEALLNLMPADLKENWVNPKSCCIYMN
jgi:hypothetical protein